MAVMTRGVLVAVTACLAVVPIGMFFGSAPPIGTFHRVLCVLAGLGGLAGALLWLHRFPTKNQSVAFSVATSLSIACAVLAQTDPLTAILGCTAFATISGYIALFHTPALMVANLGIVIAVSAVPAAALVVTDGYVRAVSAYGVVLIGNIAVPYGVQIIVHTLGVDLLKADRDPLTGLYNRRAFYRRTAALATADDGHGDLLIAMIDLDKFKRLNDTHGHTHGDLALAAVGQALRDPRAPRGNHRAGWRRGVLGGRRRRRHPPHRGRPSPVQSRRGTALPDHRECRHRLRATPLGVGQRRPPFGDHHRDRRRRRRDVRRKTQRRQPNSTPRRPRQVPRSDVSEPDVEPNHAPLGGATFRTRPSVDSTRATSATTGPRLVRLLVRNVYQRSMRPATCSR